MTKYQLLFDATLADISDRLSDRISKILPNVS